MRKCQKKRGVFYIFFWTSMSQYAIFFKYRFDWIYSLIVSFIISFLNKHFRGICYRIAEVTNEEDFFPTINLYKSSLQVWLVIAFL